MLHNFGINKREKLINREGEMIAKFSEKDSRGAVHVDCSECNRGINGNDKDKCCAGAKPKYKKGGKGGCYLGELIDGLKIK